MMNLFEVILLAITLIVVIFFSCSNVLLYQRAKKKRKETDNLVKKIELLQILDDSVITSLNEIKQKSTDLNNVIDAIQNIIEDVGLRRRYGEYKNKTDTIIHLFTEISSTVILFNKLQLIQEDFDKSMLAIMESVIKLGSFVKLIPLTFHDYRNAQINEESHKSFIENTNKMKELLPDLKTRIEAFIGMFLEIQTKTRKNIDIYLSGITIYDMANDEYIDTKLANKLQYINKLLQTPYPLSSTKKETPEIKEDEDIIVAQPEILGDIHMLQADFTEILKNMFKENKPKESQAETEESGS